MSGSLDRNRIMKLFETLSARLAARGIRGQLYIVDGSAMIVGYGRERTTRDVDARIEYAKDEVLAAAEEIAARRIWTRTGEYFDALLSMDRSLPHQQNLKGLGLRILIIRAPSNRMVHLRPLSGPVRLV